jgi:hypothetical protein
MYVFPFIAFAVKLILGSAEKLFVGHDLSPFYIQNVLFDV